jgi:hypothetical protein
VHGIDIHTCEEISNESCFINPDYQEDIPGYYLPNVYVFS